MAPAFPKTPKVAPAQTPKVAPAIVKTSLKHLRFDPFLVFNPANVQIRTRTHLVNFQVQCLNKLVAAYIKTYQSERTYEAKLTYFDHLTHGLLKALRLHQSEETETFEKMLAWARLTLLQSPCDTLEPCDFTQHFPAQAFEIEAEINLLELMEQTYVSIAEGPASSAALANYESFSEHISDCITLKKRRLYDRLSHRKINPFSC